MTALFAELSERYPFTTGQAQILASPGVRINLPTSTTVYVVVESAFATSTMTVDGFIRARRPR
jgi:hypothetical protein